MLLLQLTWPRGARRLSRRRGVGRRVAETEPPDQRRVFDRRQDDHPPRCHSRTDGARVHTRRRTTALRPRIDSNAITGISISTTCRQSATERTTYAKRSLISLGTSAYRDQTRRAKSRL